MTDEEKLVLAIRGLILALQYIKLSPPMVNAQGQGNIYDEQFKITLRLRKICKDLSSTIKEEMDKTRF